MIEARITSGSLGNAVRLSAKPEKGQLIRLIWPCRTYKETAKVLSLGSRFIKLAVPHGYIEKYRIER